MLTPAVAVTAVEALIRLISLLMEPTEREERANFTLFVPAHFAVTIHNPVVVVVCGWGPENRERGYIQKKERKCVRKKNDESRLLEESLRKFFVDDFPLNKSFMGVCEILIPAFRDYARVLFWRSRGCYATLSAS